MTAFFSSLFRRSYRRIMLPLLIVFFSTVVYAQDTAGVSSFDKKPVDTAIDHEGAPIREKHLYDSSERFFNWKETIDEVFDKRPVHTNASADSFVAKLKKDKDFWYVDQMKRFHSNRMLYRRRTDSTGKNGGVGQYDQQLMKDDTDTTPAWVRIASWTVVGALLLFGLIYFLSSNNLSFFARRDEAFENADGNAEGVVNIFDSQFSEMLAKAEKEGNYRLVIRLRYLQTLRMLSDKALIKYSPVYTNLDYLNQLRSGRYYPGFFTITRHYEYVWYGKFDLSEPMFRQLENTIRSFQNELR